MAEEAAALPGAITINFLRSYPALNTKTDEQLLKILTILNEQLIETRVDLDNVSRDSLLSKLPALALDALKPEQPQPN
eukprot:scaffold239368_cov49-Attheya_sp.AAC.1